MQEKDTDCPDPICFKTDPLKSYANYKGGSRQQLQFKEDKEDIFSKNPKNNGNSETEEHQKKEEDPYKACPLNRDSLGFYTWNFLHTMGMYYPENPNQELKQKAIDFFNSFAFLYPCKVCRSHFQKDIIKYPPQVDSNKDLSIWLCHRHNDVNKWHGKPIFDCSFENLEKRWKTGYDHCQEDDHTV